MKEVTRRRARLISLCLVLLLAQWQTITISAQTNSASASQTHTLPPPHIVPAHNYDLRHVKLDLRFDWEREQALGTTTLTFAPTAPNVQSVEFDAANMTFTGVQTSTGAALKYATDERAEKLRVELDRAYQPSETVTITIAYHTNGRVHELGSGNYASAANLFAGRIGIQSPLVSFV